MPQLTLLNSLLFLCVTLGVASAVYAMLLVREAYVKHEDKPENKKKILKKAYFYILLAVLFTAARLIVTYYMKK